MKVEAVLSHWSSPCAPHHAETRLCISLPFSISFIANIARKRPELNRDKTSLRQLGKRLIAFYAPELLSSEQQNSLKEFLKNRWSPNLEKVPWTTESDIWSSLNNLGPKIEMEAWVEFYKTRIKSAAS